MLNYTQLERVVAQRNSEQNLVHRPQMKTINLNFQEPKKKKKAKERRQYCGFHKKWPVVLLYNKGAQHQACLCGNKETSSIVNWTITEQKLI
jgi:hypothetical protein